MKRSKMSRSASRSDFRRNAKSKQINHKQPVSRGGIRL